MVVMQMIPSCLGSYRGAPKKIFWARLEVHLIFFRQPATWMTTHPLLVEKVKSEKGSIHNSPQRPRFVYFFSRLSLRP
jgi:hypothetical protein